jgi:hypothetical protein
VKILGIDPGNTHSAYTVIDHATRQPILIGKIPNIELLDAIAHSAPQVGHIGIEMIASYGMAVGREVFETCVWIGRFQQAAIHAAPEVPVELVYRRDVKLHHCGTSKAKDANIAQALVDRFATSPRNHGKGTKADPGWFYGFHKDIWQAYALTVYTADTIPPPVQIDLTQQMLNLAHNINQETLL